MLTENSDLNAVIFFLTQVIFAPFSTNVSFVFLRDRWVKQHHLLVSLVHIPNLYILADLLYYY